MNNTTPEITVTPSYELKIKGTKYKLTRAEAEELEAQLSDALKKMTVVAPSYYPTYWGGVTVTSNANNRILIGDVVAMNP